jgi:hypothetical protein
MDREKNHRKNRQLLTSSECEVGSDKFSIKDQNATWNLPSFFCTTPQPTFLLPIIKVLTSLGKRVKTLRFFHQGIVMEPKKAWTDDLRQQKEAKPLDREGIQSERTYRT